MHIQEVIIVEGNHDSALLKSLVDCDTIVTHGSTLSETTRRLIQQAAQKHAIIIFTDPDTTGEKIRRQIVKLVPEAKHAFLPQHLALGKGKMKHIQTFSMRTHTLTMSDLIELGLAGLPHSEELRRNAAHFFKMGDCNAKTFMKRCDMLEIDKQQLTDCVEKLWKNR
jgi:ribonuclease M5